MTSWVFPTLITGIVMFFIGRYFDEFKSFLNAIKKKEKESKKIK